VVAVAAAVVVMLSPTNALTKSVHSHSQRGQMDGV
jgi:hypothetical protein